MERALKTAVFYFTFLNNGFSACITSIPVRLIDDRSKDYIIDCYLPFHIGLWTIFTDDALDQIFYYLLRAGPNHIEVVFLYEQNIYKYIMTDN